MKSRRVLSVFLSLCLLLSAVPLTAFAGAHTHRWDMDHVRWIIDADEDGVNAATATFVCLDDYSHELVKTYDDSEMEIEIVTSSVVTGASCSSAGEKQYVLAAILDEEYSNGEVEHYEVTTQYNVQISPLGHDPEHVPAVEATTSEEGNIEYWQCSRCGKCFSDENCTAEITQESTVIPVRSESEVYTWAELQQALNEGGDVTLGANITAGSGDSALVVYSERSVIHLNGYTIDRGLSSPTADGSVIAVYGFLRLDGPGTITGGCTTGYGGGIAIKGDGAVNMYGATITGNGAVGANNKSGGGGIGIDGNGSFYMEGGAITNNFTGNTNGNQGGGVYIGRGCFDFVGGTISGNTSSGQGAGVYVLSTSELYFCGDTCIVENNTRAGEENNVYFAGKAEAYADRYLDAGSRIGVSSKASNGTILTLSDPDLLPYFFSDNDAYLLRLEEDEVRLVPNSFQITIDGDILNGTVTADKQTARSGETVTLTAAPDAGYLFKSWDVTDENGDPVEVANDRFVMPAGSVTVSATFDRARYYNLDSVHPIENGTIYLPGYSALAGETVTVTAEPDADRVTASLTVLADDEDHQMTYTHEVPAQHPDPNTITFTMPSANVMIYATFSDCGEQRVFVRDMQGGTVASDKNLAQYGDTITLTVQPDNGYAYDPESLTVTEVDPYGSEHEIRVEETQNDGEFTFAMPSYNAYIYAEFTKLPETTKYAVWLDDEVEFGTLTADYAEASEGWEVRVTAAPDAQRGFALQSLTVSDTNGNAITTTDRGSNVYSFRMPADNVFVSAVFALPVYNITAVRRDVCAAATGCELTTDSEAQTGDIVRVRYVLRPDTSVQSLTVTGDTTGNACPISLDYHNNGSLLYVYKFTMPNEPVTVRADFTDGVYGVTANVTGHGTVEADNATAAAGETVTLTVTPDTYSRLASLTATDMNGNPVTVTNQTFTMPASNVTVNAVFTDDPTYTLTVCWTSVVAPDSVPAPVVVSGVHAGTTVADAMTRANYTVTFPPFAKLGYEGRNQYLPQPMTAYASFDEMYAARVNATEIEGDMTVYYPMLKQIDAAEITISAPVCGTSTAAQNVNAPWAGQTNAPTLTVPQNAHYAPDTAGGTLAAWWLAGTQSSAAYVGSFTGGSDYFAGIALKADHGYCFRVDAEALTVNGGDLNSIISYGGENLLEAVVQTTAVHIDSAEGVVTTRPTAASPTGEITYYCTECGQPSSTASFVGEVFTVTTPSGLTGGSVTSSQPTACEGETITITATPDAHYALDTLTVTDENGEEIEVTDNNFVMPAGDVTVTASFYENYAIWVGGELITEKNKSDVFGNGSVRYEGNLTEGTLYLTNADISGSFLFSSLFADNDKLSLSIALGGENIASGAYYGANLYCKDVTIIGDGSLSATGSGEGLYIKCPVTVDGATLTVRGESSFAMEIKKDLLIRNSDVTAIGGRDMAIDSSGILSIEGSTVQATAQQASYALYGAEGITITDSTVTAEANYNYAILPGEGKMTITNSTVTATSEKNCAILAVDTVTITDSIVTADSRESTGIFIKSKLIIEGKSELIANTEYDNIPAVKFSSLELGESLAIAAPNNSVIRDYYGDSFNAVFEADGQTTAQHVVIGSAYAVNITENARGAVTTNKPYACAGDTVTLTVTPNAHYALDTLTVTDADGDPVTLTNNTFVMPAKDVTVTASFYAVYPLWVGGVEVTEKNKTDILGDGSAVYEGDLTGGTLTLTDANITGLRNASNIYTFIPDGDVDFNLTIALSGDNTLSGGNYGVYFYSRSRLTITGSGSLTASGSTDGIYTGCGCQTLIDGTTVTASAAYNFGIECNSSPLTIQDSTVTSTGSYMGIDASDLSITNSEVSATAEGISYALYSTGTMRITDSTVNATAESAYGICSGGNGSAAIIIENSSVSASSGNSDGIEAAYSGIMITDSTVETIGYYQGLNCNGTLTVNGNSTVTVNNRNAGYAALLAGDLSFGNGLGISEPENAVIKTYSYKKAVYQSDGQTLADHVVIGRLEAPLDEISVTIDDGIGVNFLLNLDHPSRADVDSITVTYKNFSGETVTETYAKSELTVENGKYKVTVRIAPAQLADMITVTFGNTRLEQSVYGYCEDLKAGDYEQRYKNVAIALENYAQAAKVAFDYPGDTITNIDGLTAAEGFGGWEYQFGDSTGKIGSISFLALTKPEFRFYMPDVTEAEAAACTVTASFKNGGTTGSLKARFAKDAGGNVLIEVTGLQAQDLGRTVKISIDGLADTTKYIEFAGYDFAKLMTANSSTEKLGIALYNYGFMANACWGTDA